MVRCIKLAKNDIQQRQTGLAERTRAGAGGTVVVGWNPACSLNFSFFSPTFEKFLSFFGGLVCQYSKRKIFSTGAGTVDTAFFKSTQVCTWVWYPNSYSPIMLIMYTIFSGCVYSPSTSTGNFTLRVPATSPPKNLESF